jgi:hypothetical protein
MPISSATSILVLVRDKRKAL